MVYKTRLSKHCWFQEYSKRNRNKPSQVSELQGDIIIKHNPKCSFTIELIEQEVDECAHKLHRSAASSHMLIIHG